MSEELEQSNSEAPKRKKPFVLIGVALLLAVAAGTVWMMRHRTVSAAAPEPDGHTEHSDHADRADQKPKSIIHLESFVVNLADRDQKTFLRVGMDLASDKEPSKKEGGVENGAATRDAIISVLTGCTADDLLTPEGKQQLKTDLLKTLNDRTPDLRVREIYFTDFLVQR